MEKHPFVHAYRAWGDLIHAQADIMEQSTSNLSEWVNLQKQTAERMFDLWSKSLDTANNVVQRAAQQHRPGQAAD